MAMEWFCFSETETVSETVSCFLKTRAIHERLLACGASHTEKLSGLDKI